MSHDCSLFKDQNLASYAFLVGGFFLTKTAFEMSDDEIATGII